MISMTGTCLAGIFLLAWSLFGGGEKATPPPPPPVATPSVDIQALVSNAVQKAVSAAVAEAAEKAAKTVAAEKVLREAKEAEEKAAREAAKLAEKEARALAKEDLEYASKIEAEKRSVEQEELRRIESRIFKLEYVSAEEVAEKFNAMWSGDFGVTWKISKMAVAFPESNSMMVTAPRAILKVCEQSLKDLDVEAKQVYIEARFVELSNNASHKLGIDWQMLDGMKGSLALDAGLHERNIDGISNFNSSDGTYTIDASKNTSASKANLSYINGTIGMSELFVTLRALESSEDARVFSNPKIIVSSGKKATVDMTTKYPNIKISAKRTSNTGGDSLDLDMQMAAIPGEDKMMFAKEAFFSWGISLDVTPRISTNGVISVEIVPTISDRTDWASTGASGEDAKDESTTISAKYPVLNVQRLVTTFDMASGTTAVIGGLSRTVETQKDNGIPWLRDIWWIGPKVFGSKVRIKEQKEIIVFVTVGLVEPKAIARDAGLPKNAVMGRQYTDGVRREPGDRRRRTEGVNSLDLRSLEEQYADPRRTNRVNKASWAVEDMPLPFTKDPEYKKTTGKDKNQ